MGGKLLSTSRDFAFPESQFYRFGSFSLEQHRTIHVDGTHIIQVICKCFALTEFNPDSQVLADGEFQSAAKRDGQLGELIGLLGRILG